MLGSVTVRKVRAPEAPSVSAASSSARPCSIITGINSRATKGMVMNMVASTMPGTAKTTCMPLAIIQAPSAVLAPNSSTKHSPATTGETENGRSINVIRKALPRKSNLAMAQAAAMPKTAFSGTAMAAVSRVSRIAERASGSCRVAAAKATPCFSASAKTAIRGANSSKVSRTSTTPISRRRSQSGSVVARRNRGAAV